jgi:hypothetical protein
MQLQGYKHSTVGSIIHGLQLLTVVGFHTCLLVFTVSYVPLT